MTTALALEARGLRKAFGACVANESVSLRVAWGTIHAIIGENGAGKSTAMKMLYGVYAPDDGEILVDGKPRVWTGPGDAMAAGIGMVHQHFMLSGPETAVDNVILSALGPSTLPAALPRSLRVLDRARTRARLEELARKYGLAADLNRPVEDLPVGVQQRVEILKLLYQDARLLILDEPTAVLTPQETDDLFGQLRRLRDEGKTILIITHKLREVLALADHVTVLRGGRVVGERPVAGATSEELAALMVGRRVELVAKAPPPPKTGEVALEIRDLTWRSRGTGKARLDGLALSVRRGEVVGIAGVEGNGQSELLKLLQIPRSMEDGVSERAVVRVLGEDLLNQSRSTRPLRMGVIPEDRHRDGLMLERSVRDNFALGLHRDFFARPSLISKSFWWAEARADAAAREALEEFDVRPRSTTARVGGLSGGNQQKLIIGREFKRKPELLVAAQPTRGVDVGAVEFIHGRILKARGEGTAVLLVSSELEEVMGLSDRILVMYGGRIVKEFARGEASESEIGFWMTGGSK